jgi:acetyl esterase/lipase
VELWGDDAVEDRRIVSGDTVRNVTRPTLTRYGPEGDGPVVVIAPGGGMHMLSIASEGTGPAELLAAHGIRSYVLEYRVIPTPVDEAEHLAAFAPLFVGLPRPPELIRRVEGHRPTTTVDGLQALRLVRQKHERVAFLGFSGGGILTADLLAQDSAEDRPDAAALVYTPFMTPAKAAPDAPPIFVLATADDPFGTEGSTELYRAWSEAGRPVELHLYPQGGHGFGVTRTGFAVDVWPDLLLTWLRANGF